MNAESIYRSINIPLAIVVVLAGTSAGRAIPAQERAEAEKVRITILSSNLANVGMVGEWGFSALVEVDDRCVLFDSGWSPDTVLRNARALNVDLSCVTDVVLSHFHADHMGGLVTLFNDLRRKNPHAMERFHAAEGMFLPRRTADGGDEERNTMIAIRQELEAAGATFFVYSGPQEILPAVWITGPVERVHAEKTFSPGVRVNVDGEWIEDNVPDSQGLTVVTKEGPIVVLGCGHSGSVNLLEQVRRTIQDESIHALMGGMHLFAASNVDLDWTAKRLSNIGVEHLMAGHCTGVEPMFRLRQGLGLTRKTAVIGAVGSRFVLGEGIHPTAIAQ
jgi:7,8-dihydropterin-6-yl-methyl-4-(beta-D-ribofuranosyl)aminobenzene 5'-phosphate synthase